MKTRSKVGKSFCALALQTDSTRNWNHWRKLERRETNEYSCFMFKLFLTLIIIFN